MAKLILGITGEMGSGKGTIAAHVIEKHMGSTHRFSTMLRDVLDRLYIEQTRENIAQLSTILRKNFGEDCLSNVMMHDAQNDDRTLVIIDGVRRKTDIVHLEGLPHFKLVYIDADIKTRYERIIKRGENAGESQKTFEEFQKDHEHEAESQIVGLKKEADYVIDNNGNFQQLYDQINKIIAQNLK